MAHKIFIRFTIPAFLFVIICVFVEYNLQTSLHKNISPSKLIQPSLSSLKSVPTLARILYLFLCENQAEINAYSKAFPSITADVMFLCWKENCNDTNFPKFMNVYAIKWSGRVRNSPPFVQLNSTLDYTMVKPRVFIINERQLNLTRKTTWTTARNMLYERAIIEEHHQGWRWAYFNFGDGDIQINCPRADKFLQTNESSGDELVIAQQFRTLINLQQSLDVKIKLDQCFILFDTFLLSVSPAIASIDGMLIPPLFDGLLTQIVYHIDAMFNAFHRDALPFVLPYCARYDSLTWWTSQAILIYRSLCLYGHAIQFNAVSTTGQKHREYPRTRNAWIMDEDMNLVPSSLIPMKMYMKQARVVSALALQHYSGWSLELTSDECRNRHTVVDPRTCKVGEKENITNSSLS
jgi:hypothetical protein